MYGVRKRARKSHEELVERRDERLPVEVNARLMRNRESARQKVYTRLSSVTRTERLVGFSPSRVT